MSLEGIAKGLSEAGQYSCQFEEGVFRIANLETGSEYVLEEFGASLQLRQAVFFDCFDLSKAELDILYVLCSLMNERFSGCKNYIDRWGVLVTAADILSTNVEYEEVQVALGQVEFISQAMLELVGISRAGLRVVTEEELDNALDVAPLQ